MLITGVIEYNNNVVLSEEKVNIDTTQKSVAISKNIVDAVAFALFGKTVFDAIITKERGVPMISLQIICGDNEVSILRQPQYWRKTSLGSTYLANEKFYLQDEHELDAEKFYEKLNSIIDMSYEQFSAYCKEQ